MQIPPFSGVFSALLRCHGHRQGSVTLPQYQIALTTDVSHTASISVCHGDRCLSHCLNISLPWRPMSLTLPQYQFAMATDVSHTASISGCHGDRCLSHCLNISLPWRPMSLTLPQYQFAMATDVSHTASISVCHGRRPVPHKPPVHLIVSCGTSVCPYSLSSNGSHYS